MIAQFQRRLHASHASHVKVYANATAITRHCRQGSEYLLRAQGEVQSAVLAVLGHPAGKVGVLFGQAQVGVDWQWQER